MVTRVLVSVQMTKALVAVKRPQNVETASLELNVMKTLKICC